MTDDLGRPAAVAAEGWGWRYGSRNAWAARDVSLRIEPGERVLLVGASGSGKSTLLHALAGVLGGADEGDQAGSLTIDGASPRSVIGRAGLVQQDPESQAVLARVGDDVAFGCENLGVPRDEIWPRVRDALALVGLDVPLDRSTSALSGGQKQRLALAGALAMRPGLLLLDEPTANIDIDGADDVRDAVGRVLDATGATLVVVEHRIETWLPLVDRVIVLGRSADDESTEVVADGPASAVLDEQRDRLSARGIWVPDAPLRMPTAPRHEPGGVLIEARELSVGRGAAVAHPVDVEVRAGEALAILGRNGAGKSTLARTVAGLLRPLAGQVEARPSLANGAGPDPLAWRSKQLLTRIGTVLQSPQHQLLARTVRAELSIGPIALKRDRAVIEARVDALLATLRLDRLAGANPHTLSGGEKRRLTVGAMLATAPKVCIFDEPTFGQDALTWVELVQLMADIRDGIDGEPAGVVVVTHDDRVLEGLTARRLVVKPVVQGAS